MLPDMDLETQLVELYNDLENMHGSFNDQGAVGRVFNALLAEVKQQYGGNPIVAAVDEVGLGPDHTLGSAEALRTVVGQLVAVVRS